MPGPGALPGEARPVDLTVVSPTWAGARRRRLSDKLGRRWRSSTSGGTHSFQPGQRARDHRAGRRTNLPHRRRPDRHRSHHRQGAQALKDHGATAVVVAATHAVFSDPATEILPERVHRLRRRDRHPAGTEAKRWDRLTVLSIAPLPPAPSTRSSTTLGHVRCSTAPLSLLGGCRGSRRRDEDGVRARPVGRRSRDHPFGDDPVAAGRERVRRRARYSSANDRRRSDEQPAVAALAKSLPSIFSEIRLKLGRG